MARIDVEAAFSRHRLGGEPIPDDVRILLGHAEELAERTEVRLAWDEAWSPWLDTSYLTPEDRRNPDVMANVLAIAEVCELVAFVAATDEDEYLGYWRGPDRLPVRDAPLVRLDGEGCFSICGATFAEALLGRTLDDDGFAELRDWFRSLGVAVAAESLDSLEDPVAHPDPDRVHQELYLRRLGEGPEA